MEIVWLGGKACKHCSVVGGKGAGLCHLSADFRVPPLFCVTAEAHSRWAAEIDQANEHLPGPLYAQLAQAYAELAALSGSAEPGVAVRSSALDEDGQNASFAGQHQTFLNVQGIDAVARAVIQCWASARSPQALAYRRQQGLPLDTRMAVLVQQLIPADVSAVVFTANPVTGDLSEIVINANWGLGESLVSAAVTPDMFVVRKADLSVIARQVAAKQIMTVLGTAGVKTVPVPRLLRRQPSLSEEQISELARLGLRLEEIMGQPVDVECAYRGGLLYLLQCRPITTLEERT